MDVENQIINVKVNNFTEKHFKKIGYNVKNGDRIDIPVKDLPSGSGLKILVRCNYCKETFLKSYRRYLETKGDICCEKCKVKKILKVSTERYGNPCSLRNPEIEEKNEV